MSITPPINRFLFVSFVLMTLIVGTAALIWPVVRAYTYAPLRDILFPNVFLPTRAGMPVTLMVAVPPGLEDWVKTSAADFSKTNTLIHVATTQVHGQDASTRLNTITAEPDVWIAEADFVRSAAGGLPYETQGISVAQDSFLWVAVRGQNRISGQLNWETISQWASQNPYFKIGIPAAGSVEGMAACWAAAAEVHHQKNVTASQISDPNFRKWLSTLLQAAPDRNRSPLDQLSTRPPQVDVGLIMNSDWSQLSQSSFNQQNLDNNVIFNYPYFIRSNWSDVQADEANARKAAAAKFRDYLLSSGPQSKLAGYGLVPASTRLAGQLPSIDDSTVQALRFCWQ